MTLNGVPIIFEDDSFFTLPCLSCDGFLLKQMLFAPIIALRCPAPVDVGLYSLDLYKERFTKMHASKTAIQ